MNEQSKVARSKIYTPIHTTSKLKVRTNILLQRETLETAQELGLNVSKVCENSLKLYTEAMQNVNLMNKPDFSVKPLSVKRVLVDRAGFGPTTSALRMRRSYQAELPAQRFLREKNPR
jgi:hypothetical protein